MRHSPLRLLVSSYGLAVGVAALAAYAGAGSAVLAAYAGAGFGASLLTFWLASAAVVLALALRPGVMALFARLVPEWPFPVDRAQDRAPREAEGTTDAGRGALPIPMVEAV